MAFVWPFLGIGIGVLLVVVGVILGWAVMPPIIDDQVAEATQIVKGTDQYDRWVELPQPLHFKVYFFEIQNPEEVHAGEALPIVKEKGPYIYRQKKWKTNIEFSYYNTTASFDGHRSYEFDEAASGDLKDTDEIHIVNPMMTSIFQTLEMDEVRKHLLSAISVVINPRIFDGNTNFFIKTTPRDILFEGVKFCINPTGGAVSICNNIRAVPSHNIVQTPDYLSFALFRHKETYSEGNYEVNTGINDPALTHTIERFNGFNKLTTWPDDKDENDNTVTSSCNTLFGSDGSLFPPFPSEDSPLPSLQTDICRIISVYYDGEDEYEGITGMVYRTGKDFVEEIGKEFGNECLCVNQTQGIMQENGCLYKGAVDLFNCLGGPIIMTKPHMLDADEQYTSLITGFEPDFEKHSTKMLIEPYTGTPLQGFKRIQLNVFLRPIFKLKISENYIPALMPLLWIDEGIELNEKMITLLNEELYDSLETATIVTWVIIGVGAAAALGSILWYFLLPK